MELAEFDRLVSLDDEALYKAVCEEELLILVDWKDEEEEVIDDFARHLPGLDLEPFWDDDDQFHVRVDGEEFAIPLTFSPVDRYVAIGSLASLLAGRYEVRILRMTLGMDTHGLLVLPLADWSALDAKHPAWVREKFGKLEPGKDYFGGGIVPHARRG